MAQSSNSQRFRNDLESLKALSKKGWELYGIQIKGLRAGDDEGSVEFSLIYDDDPLAKPSLLFTDTSAYPGSTCIAYDREEEANETVSEVLENIASDSPRLLKDTVTRMVNSIASALGLCDEDEEMHDVDSDDNASLDDGVGGMDKFQAPQIAQQTAALKRDFLEVVAADWKPGVFRFGSDFVVCVSCPVVKLSTPANSLAAWDRRLLLPDQHLTLLISGFRGSYPPLTETGQVLSGFAKIRFNVGLSDGKPDKDIVGTATRDFGLVEEDKLIPEPEPEPVILEYDENDPDTWDIAEKEPTPEPEITHDPGRFDRFSLSTSLNSLLNDSLITLIQLRLRFGIGWAGAEVLLAEQSAKQISAEQAYNNIDYLVSAADKEERSVALLPIDPLVRPTGAELKDINLPLVAFSYLVRRVLLCPRFCIVCHQRIQTDFVALKPYVCDKNLCAYQFYALSFGTSIEYDLIHNPAVVDLLVSFTCVSALEGQLSEELPVGIGLRIPRPSRAIGGRIVQQYHHGSTVPQSTEEFDLEPGLDGLYDFDKMPVQWQRGGIVDMLNKIPKVIEMRRYLLKVAAQGKARGRQNVRNMADDVPAAAWTLLRWCVSSCTAYIEELSHSSERVQNLETSGLYHQFRFSVGSPQAEAKFQAAVRTATATDSHARKYPTIYAWHGSPLLNWHSIIRQGLHYKDVAHGRAYGNGVYFAKDANISMGYARPSSSRWKNSELVPTTALAIAEIVNQTSKFVSTNPYYVVPDVTWISTRYLLVQSASVSQTIKDSESEIKIKTMSLDPSNQIFMNSKPLGIPILTDHLELIVKENRKKLRDKPMDDEDREVFEYEERPTTPPRVLPKDDWKHVETWVAQTDYQLLQPPSQASPMSAMHLQKELKFIMDEQRKAKSLKELGYYISPDLIGDNLFQWMVELHSFDKDLPLAKDMAKNNVNSLLFEIRFPSTFPHSPPFFRLIKPRLLPFLQGGGGHITAGGSVCMDLLVQDGWLPSYNIAAVLLQIRMAVSSTDPRPARLAPGSEWKRAYSTQEALDGFNRAAATHGWRVPDGTRQLVLQ